MMDLLDRQPVLLQLHVCLESRAIVKLVCVCVGGKSGQVQVLQKHTEMQHLNCGFYSILKKRNSLCSPVHYRALNYTLGLWDELTALRRHKTKMQTLNVQNPSICNYSHVSIVYSRLTLPRLVEKSSKVLFFYKLDMEKYRES